MPTYRIPATGGVIKSGVDLSKLVVGRGAARKILLEKWTVCDECVILKTKEDIEGLEDYLVE